MCLRRRLPVVLVFVAFGCGSPTKPESAGGAIHKAVPKIVPKIVTDNNHPDGKYEKPASVEIKGEAIGEHKHEVPNRQLEAGKLEVDKNRSVPLGARRTPDASDAKSR